MIQLNKSSFGLTPQNPGIQFPTPIMPGSSAQTLVPMSVTPNMVNPGDPNANLQVSPNQCNSESTQTQRAFHVSRAPQVAIKNPHLQGQNSVFYFQMLYQVYVLLKPSNPSAKGGVMPSTPARRTLRRCMRGPTKLHKGVPRTGM